MANRKISILFLIDCLTTRDGLTGGTERQLVQIVTRLDRQRFNPILVCLREDPKSPIWESIDCEKHILDVYSLGSISGIAKFVSFVAFLKRKKVNIIQTYFFDSTVFGILAAKVARIGVTISCRRDMGFWYNKSLLWKLKIVNKLTKRILVNSYAVKEVIMQKEGCPSEQIDVISNGIDICEIDKQSPAQLNNVFKDMKGADKIVGIVGNYNRRIKRFDLFLQTAAEVLKRLNNIKFLVIGGGVLENELKTLASKLDISQHVAFLGKKENSIPYIKNFDIGALTSDSEGFPNVILEYMACGIPTVATNVGGTRELIENGESGILVGQGDYTGLADSICQILKDKGLIKQFSQKGREIVLNKFSWDIVINNIQLYYKKLS
jgi:L-malate glycosyltransferase